MHHRSNYIFRILYIFIFGGFLLVLSQSIFDIPFIASALYFAICWLFLFFCAYWFGRVFLPRFIALWVFIDLGILLQMLSFEHHAGHGSLSGVEFLWLVSYAPIIFPSGFLSILMTEFRNAPIKNFIEWGGSYYFQILSNWISASVAAAIQSICFYLIISWHVQYIASLKSKKSIAKSS